MRSWKLMLLFAYRLAIETTKRRFAWIMAFFARFPSSSRRSKSCSVMLHSIAQSKLLGSLPCSSNSRSCTLLRYMRSWIRLASSTSSAPVSKLTVPISFRYVFIESVCFLVSALFRAMRLLRLDSAADASLDSCNDPGSATIPVSCAFAFTRAVAWRLILELVEAAAVAFLTLALALALGFVVLTAASIVSPASAPSAPSDSFSASSAFSAKDGILYASSSSARPAAPTLSTSASAAWSCATLALSSSKSCTSMSSMCAANSTRDSSMEPPVVSAGYFWFGGWRLVSTWVWGGLIGWCSRVSRSGRARRRLTWRGNRVTSTREARRGSRSRARAGEARCGGGGKTRPRDISVTRVNSGETWGCGGVRDAPASALGGEMALAATFCPRPSLLELSCGFSQAGEGERELRTALHRTPAARLWNQEGG